MDESWEIRFHFEEDFMSENFYLDRNQKSWCLEILQYIPIILWNNETKKGIIAFNSEQDAIAFHMTFCHPLFLYFEDGQ